MENTANTSHIIQELRKIDLTEKESRCYMLLVKLGPSSVQKIARNLRLTRPTTYRLLERLEEKGLVNEAKIEGKKIRGYSAKSPDELISLLKIKKRHIAEQERELLRIISQLRSDYYGEGTTIHSYSISEESIATCLEDITAADISSVFVWHTINADATPLTRDTLAHIYDTLRTRRGDIVIHEVTSRDISLPESPFSGTLIITDQVYLFSATDITVFASSQLRDFLKMMILLLERSQK